MSSDYQYIQAHSLMVFLNLIAIQSQQINPELSLLASTRTFKIPPADAIKWAGDTLPLQSNLS